MLVFKNNYKQVFPIFREALEKCEFFSFDCEMTGVTYDLKTDPTKFDTADFRYHKFRQIVKTFELIQIGITFYSKVDEIIEGDSNIPSSNVSDNLSNLPCDEFSQSNEISIEIKKIQGKSNKYYCEKTFTFFLFKNSKLRNLNTPLNSSIISNFTTCHPAALKFLNENGFDLNNIVSNGIHYNKLSFLPQIESIVDNYINNVFLPNNIIHLSKKNESILIQTIQLITKFLISNNKLDKIDYGDNCSIISEKKFKISNLNKSVINYILSLNLKKFLNIQNFVLSKDKSNDGVLIVEKCKAIINKDDFLKTFTSYESFCNTINYSSIINARYAGVLPNIKDREILIEDEMGFSLFIDEIIKQNNKKAIPMIGHNLLFDLLFIYDKFIDNLPENFYEFKTRINKLFPIIYDNKFLTTNLAKEYDNTKLESLYKNMIKNRLDIYVPIKPDVVNGFSAYIDTESSFHDAGYDSVITGRCFIYLLKGFENMFQIENKKATNHQMGHEKLKNSKGVSIKPGFVDLNIPEYINLRNKTALSMMEPPYDVCDLDTNREKFEVYQNNQNDLVGNVFHNVYYIELHTNQYYTIYDFAKLFENDYFNISVVKIDDNKSFIQFLAAREDVFQSNDEKNFLMQQIIDNVKSKDFVSDIFSYQKFSLAYSNLIKLK